jgi:hypothetical protein
MNGRIEWNFTVVHKETRTRFAIIFEWREYLNTRSSYGALAGRTTVDTLIDLESTRSRLENACIPASSMQGSSVKGIYHEQIICHGTHVEEAGERRMCDKQHSRSPVSHHLMYPSFLKLGIYERPKELHRKYTLRVL